MRSAASTPHRNPFGDDAAAFSAGRLGMWLFLAAVGMLFAATIVGFLVIRTQLTLRDQWPSNLPPLPDLLLVSTILLIVSSATMQAALVAARRGRPRPLRLHLLVTTGLGLLFLGLQSWCWIVWLDQLTNLWAASNSFRFALSSFYVLTGVHAAHVIGGLIPLGIVTQRAFAGRYTPDAHVGVHLCAMYWHFLDGVWVLLYLTLILAV